MPVIIRGLERPVYRGYDSAGVVIGGNGKLRLEKVKGRIETLKKELTPAFAGGTVGIGHTRWATHGAPSRENAHPFTDCQGTICIVHNGIIENYHKLKEDLLAAGHVFTSETDSEVIVHLIEDALKKSPDFIAACRETFKKLEGSFAVAAINKKAPDVIVAARCNSPLVVGIGEEGNYIASDVPAFLAGTRKVVYLDNNEMVVLNGKDIAITDFSGKPRDYEVAEVEWDLATVEKGGYDKFMLKEIHEQPEAVRKTLLGRINQEKDGVIFKTQGLDAQRLAQMRKLCIVACGTAFHAGIVGRYLMEYFTDIPVEIDIASEFRYRKPKIDEHTFIMSVSQSGETADTLACIREARRRGCYLLSICNVLGSSIARESDPQIKTTAGPEIGVASTKAYSCQLTAFYLFTIYLAQLKGQMTADKARSLIKELEAVPDKIEAVFRQEKKIRKCAEKYSFVASSLYLGRGFNYPTALEGALKNKEISYIHAEGYPAGEMKHGPISLIDAELPVICICTQGAFYEKMLSNIKEVEARNGRIIAIATEGDTQVAEIAEEVIYVPPTSEVLSPIINIIPLQLFAYYAALARGCDIDKPRNLAKSVTVE